MQRRPSDLSVAAIEAPSIGRRDPGLVHPVQEQGDHALMPPPPDATPSTLVVLRCYDDIGGMHKSIHYNIMEGCALFCL